MGRSEVRDFLEATIADILPNSEPLAQSAVITSKVIMHQQWQACISTNKYLSFRGILN